MYKKIKITAELRCEGETANQGFDQDNVENNPEIVIFENLDLCCFRLSALRTKFL